MAINKSMRRVLKALSFDGIEVEASRHLANLKAIDPMKIFHKTIDYKIYNGNHQIPVRIFLPGEKMEDDLPVFLFFHGGGWVTESIDNYERICARLGFGNRSYRCIGRVPAGAGVSISHWFLRLLYGGKGYVHEPVYLEYRSG